MENIVDQIRYDHISISRILLLLQQELNRLESDAEVDFHLMLECMRYMMDYAEVIHHPKEDAMMDSVYNKLTELDPVIDEIKFQHGSIGDRSSAFNNALESIMAEQFLEKDEILSIGADYIRLQKSHMRLEEESLLKKLKQLLTDEDIEAINEKYKESPDPHIADDFEKQYSRLYQSLIGA